MSEFTISLLAALGAGAYIYQLILRNSGNNVKTAVIVAGIAGLIILILMQMLINTVDNYLS